MRKKQDRKQVPAWEFSRDIRQTHMTMMRHLKSRNGVEGRTIRGSTVTYVVEHCH